jgi:hypothetical protein
MAISDPGFARSFQRRGFFFATQGTGQPIYPGGLYREAPAGLRKNLLRPIKQRCQKLQPRRSLAGVQRQPGPVSARHMQIFNSSHAEISVVLIGCKP